MFPRSRWLLSLVVPAGFLALAAGVSGVQANDPCGPMAGQAGSEGKAIPVDPSHAKAGTVFYVADETGRNSATFTSEAPLEDIVGTSNRITGYVVFDPKEPGKVGMGVLNVPVASINTGIPLRDEHMRSAQWLDAEHHPLITYKIERTKGVKEVSRTPEHQTYDLTLVGKMTLHGQTKPLEVPARITYMQESPKTQKRAPGDLLAGRATFSFQLSDFGVTGPKGMAVIGAKLSDTPSVKISFIASSHEPEAKPSPGSEGGKVKKSHTPKGGS